MESNLLSIRCLYCGAILKVRSQENIEKMMVECPNCHKRFLVGDGIQNLQEKNNARSSEDTVYNTNKGGASHNTEETTIGPSQVKLKGVIGRLVEVATGKSHELKKGVNYIGRKSQNGSATVAIEDPTRRMSREHAIIEVQAMPDGSYKHFLRNWNNQNKTYVGNDVLAPGECVVLQNGLVVKFTSVAVRFELPDDEGTRY